jgi:hypothetical protein
MQSWERWWERIMSRDICRTYAFIGHHPDAFKPASRDETGSGAREQNFDPAHRVSFPRHQRALVVGQRRASRLQHRLRLGHSENSVAEQFGCPPGHSLMAAHNSSIMHFLGLEDAVGSGSATPRSVQYILHAPGSLMHTGNIQTAPCRSHQKCSSSRDTSHVHPLPHGEVEYSLGTMT